MPKLIIKKGDQLVRKISVPEDILAFTVGSEQGNDIILDDERISFFHLQFEKQGPEYYVRDLQSEWGTFVNGERIASRTYLQDRDVISIGFHTLTFVHPESQAADVLPARGSDNADTAPDADALDRISGVPNLDNLNSWLKQDPTVASRNGNLTRKPQDIQQTVDLLEVEENGPSEFESPRPHRTQAKMQMPKPHFEPEPEPTPPRESELDF